MAQIRKKRGGSTASEASSTRRYCKVDWKVERNLELNPRVARYGGGEGLIHSQALLRALDALHVSRAP